MGLRLQLMKATKLAESSLYFTFLSGSFHSSVVYRRESGKGYLIRRKNEKKVYLALVLRGEDGEGQEITGIIYRRDNKN